MRFRRRLGRLVDDADLDRRRAIRSRAPGRVGVDPGVRQGRDVRTLEERIERGARFDQRRSVGPAEQPQVPLHPVGQRRAGEVRRTDQQRASVVGEAEDPGLRMKGSPSRLVDAQVAVAAKIQQHPQRVGVGRAEIVADQQPQAPATIEQILEMRHEQRGA